MPVEKAIICPVDPKWLRSMLAILPVGLRGKLAPYEGCLASPSAVPERPSAGRPARRRRRPNVIHPAIR